MKINMINSIKHRIASDSILSRFCLASLICAPMALNHRARRSQSASAPRTPSFSKPKVNWLLHVSLIWIIIGGFSTSMWAQTRSYTVTVGVGVGKGTVYAELWKAPAAGDSRVSSTESVSEGGGTKSKTDGIYWLTDAFGKYYATAATGYSFVSWHENDATCTNSAAGTTSPWSTSKKKQSGGYTFVYYAKFTPNSYTIAYNNNGGSGSMDNTETEYDARVDLTKNSFTKQAYLVTYDANGGSGCATSAYSYYAFIGWRKDNASTGDPYDDEATVSNLTSTKDATVTMYAQWGSVQPVTLPTPTKDGYSFAGWYDSEDNFVDIGNVPFTPVSDITLYAKWSVVDIPGFSGADQSMKVGEGYSGFTFSNTSTPTPSSSPSDKFYYVISEVDMTSTRTIGSPDSSKVIGVEYDGETTIIRALNKGTAKITFYQQEDTDNGNNIAAGNSATYTFTVDKNANAITISEWDSWSKSDIRFDEEIATTISSNNSDGYASLSVTPTGGTTVARYNKANNKIVALYNEGTATWSISQAEDYKYYAAETKTMSVTVEMATSSCDVLNKPEAKTIGDSEYTLMWDDENAAGTLYFQNYCETNHTGGVNVDQYIKVDGVWQWSRVYQIVYNDTKWNDYGNYSTPLNQGAKGVRFSRYGTYKRYFRNVRVSRTKRFDIEDAGGDAITEIDMPSRTVGGDATTATFYIDYSTCNEVIKVVSDHPHITVSDASFSSAIAGRKAITLTYNSSKVEKIDDAVVTIYTPYDHETLTVNAVTKEKLSTTLEYIGSDSYSVDHANMNATDLFQVRDENDDLVASPVITLNTSDATKIDTVSSRTAIDFLCSAADVRITAYYTGDETYAAASNSGTFYHDIDVTKLTDAITWKSGAINEEDGKIHVWADNTLPYDIAGANSRVNYTSNDAEEDYLEIVNGATIEETTLVTKKHGEITLTATSTGDCTYATATDTKTIVIDPCPHEIIWEQNFRGLTTAEDGTIRKEYELNAYAVDSNDVETNIAINYSMPSVSFATLVGKKLTVSGIGETTITATTADDDKFATVSYPKTLKIRLYGEECESNALPDDAAKEIAFEDIKADPANPTAATYYLSAPVDSLVYYVRKFNGATTGSFELLGYDFATSSWKAMEEGYGPGDVTTDSEGSKRVVHFAASDSTVRILKWESNADIGKIHWTHYQEGSKYIKNAVAAPLKIFEANRSSITRDAENPIKVGDLFEVTITLRYCDKPHISYSYTGDYLTLTPDRTVTNDCGDYGSYTFTLSGRIPVAGTYTEHISFTTSALDEIDIPVNLVVSTNGSYTIDAANWSDDSDAASITIQSAVSVASSTHVTISSPVSVYSLAIPSGSTVTIDPTGGLTVGAGGITGDGKNNITLKAGTAGETKGQTGFLRVSPDWVGTMPNATVELYSVAYADNKERTATWQYVGIPLADDTYGWDVCTTYGQQFIYGWNEATGGWFDAYEEKIDPFKGYCLTQNNDKDGKVFTFAGQLSAPSTQEITLTYDGPGDNMGNHVLANSFTAPIDITLLTAKDFGGATGTIYLFNTGSYSASGYAVVEGANSDTKGQYIAVTPGTAHGIFIEDDTYPIVIPPMQGFCVKTDKKVTMTLDYKKLVWEANYGTHPNQPMRVVAKNTNEPNVTDFIKVTLSDGEAGDNLYLLASGSYDKSYENGYDAPKMMSDDPALPNIFSVEDDGQLAIDATSDMEGTFLGVRTGDATNYTMYFSHVDCETEWMLLDIERNEKTVITDGASYKFSAPAGQTINDRFLIVEYDGSVGVTTGTDEIKTENKIQKFIYNDQMYILKDGVLYDARGMLIRR